MRLPLPINRLTRSILSPITVRIAHVEPGLTLRVRAGHHPRLILRGARSYEPRYVDILRACIREGDTVFDIGANVGFYSILFARWADLVVAYEPDPENVSILKRNVAENRCRNIAVRTAALGAVAGSSAFSRDLVTGQTGHLGAWPTYADTLFRVARRAVIRVDVATLDAEVSMLGTPPDVLKLDVEGGEYDVLRGGVETLANHRPLLISELSTWRPDRATDRGGPASGLELLRFLEYRLWSLDDGGPVRAGETWMFLAVPAERVSEDRVESVIERIGRRGTQTPQRRSAGAEKQPSTDVESHLNRPHG